MEILDLGVQRKVIGVLASNLGGLMISGANGFTVFLDGQVKKKRPRSKSFRAGEAIHSGMKITKVADEIAYGENIFNGAELYTGLKFDQNWYNGNIQDISILPELEKKRARL